jgi:hypothetical protein
MWFRTGPRRFRTADAVWGGDLKPDSGLSHRNIMRRLLIGRHLPKSVPISRDAAD